MTSTVKADPTAPPVASTPRVQWIDAAKGIGIVLVVIGHVWSGLRDAKLPIPDRTFVAVHSLIYSFHMAMFFLLSGLFVARSARKPAGTFLTEKAGAILYPYVLWSFIIGAMNILAGGQANHPLTFGRLLLDILYEPYSIFWFLYALFIVMALYLAMDRAGLSHTAMLALAAAWYFSPLILGDIPWWPADTVRGNLVYFLLGAWLSPRLQTIAAAARNRQLLLITAIALPAYIACACLGVRNNIATQPLGALLGSTAVICIAILMSRVGVPALVALGKFSLQIYAAHVLGTAGARLLLMKALHVTAVIPHLLAGVLAGLLLPLSLVWISTRLRAPWLFQFQQKRPA